jgi:hypothetical protein
MALIKLTFGKAGVEEWVNTDAIVHVRAPKANSGSMITFNTGGEAKGRYYQESPADIAKAAKG